MKQYRYVPVPVKSTITLLEKLKTLKLPVPGRLD